jgi:DNA primase
MTTDLFKQARESITIGQAWEMLGLQGEPKATCKSPFRDERTASFTIYENGTKWKDHGEQIGGDVVEFIKHAIDGDYPEVREWLQARIGIMEAPRTTAKASVKAKRIEYPTTTTEGTERHWQALARARGFNQITVEFLAKFGMVKFMHHAGKNCFIVTDATNRNAEIRNLDGSLFSNGKKAYALPGVDKSWLIGAEILKHAPDANVLLVEGATDFLTAWDINVQYRKQLGKTAPKWTPVSLLGAACKALHPECEKLLAGRHVRIVPDGDKAGDDMRDHWTALLQGIGCSVDIVELPRGKDLTDLKNEIQPHELFAL